MQTTLLTGPVAPLAGTDAESAIAKTPAPGPLWLGAEGLQDDAQADRSGWAEDGRPRLEGRT